jgi:hypothetical protein
MSASRAPWISSIGASVARAIAAQRFITGL